MGMDRPVGDAVGIGALLWSRTRELVRANGPGTQAHPSQEGSYLLSARRGGRPLDGRSTVQAPIQRLRPALSAVECRAIESLLRPVASSRSGSRRTPVQEADR